MLALVERFNLREPDILISCSGSAGTGSYFVARQFDSIRNIWINLLPAKKFISLPRFWRMINIDYLIDEIFKKQDPLNVRAIYSSPTNYLIPALNRRTGRIDYFSNRDNPDFFEAMRATKAMPIAFKLNPNIVLDNSTYCDSCLSSSVETHLEKAVELGARKILMVDNSLPSYVSDMVFGSWICFQGSYFGRNYTEAQRRSRDYYLPEEVKIFRIKPRRPLAMTTLNNDQ